MCFIAGGFIGGISMNILCNIRHQREQENSKKQITYWKNRCLYMESKFAPDSNPFFDAAEIQDLHDDIISHFAEIPFIGTFIRWNKKQMARNNLQQIREKMEWNRKE